MDIYELLNKLEELKNPLHNQEVIIKELGNTIYSDIRDIYTDNNYNVIIEIAR